LSRILCAVTAESRRLRAARTRVEDRSRIFAHCQTATDAVDLNQQEINARLKEDGWFNVQLA
jgi:hypothetical protein